MSETDPTPEESFAWAQERIAEAKAANAFRLNLNEPEGRALERLPDEIGDLTQLKTLDLRNTQVFDLGALSGLSGLQMLYLNNTQVSDLRALEGLSGLHTLFLNDTQVSDLGALSGLSGLQTLTLNNTQVADLRALAGLSGLRELLLDNTPVSDLRALEGLSGLQVLTLNNTPVANLLPLAGFSQLGDGRFGGLRFAGTPAAERDDAHRVLAEIADSEDCAKQVLQYLNGEHPEFGGPPEPWVVQRTAREPLPDLEDVFQDQGGLQFTLSATFAAFSVARGSVAAPASAEQLLPRLRSRVAQALAVYNGAEDDPAALILSDLQEMDRIVGCSMPGIAAEALALWELSVGLASYLDEDSAAVKKVVNYPTLGEARRGVLKRLINSSAIFVRMFPGALELDESHKDFLLNASRECLPSQITDLAQLYALLEARSVDLIKAVEEIARRPGPQSDKAEAVSTKGSRNLIAVAVAFAMGAVANGFFENLGADLSEEMKLCIRSAHFVHDSQDEVRAFCADAPDDLRKAVESAIEAIAGSDLPPLPPKKP